MIPCKRTKCLKYPICRNKTVVNCSLLNQHHFNTLDRFKTKVGYSKGLDMAWDHIHRHLPYVTSIRQSDGVFKRY